jgi:nucleotide-binding universal stress UspA family protein
MRILFATDSSPSATRAQALLASLKLPDPTTIEILNVDLLYDERDLPHAQLAELHRLLRADTDTELAAVKAALEGPGRTVTTSVHFGRPASVIVETAERSHADLIVVGSRGHGRFASALLGSVAAEVVDHAPCPVLVARGTSIDRVILAADDSPGSRRAEDVAASLAFVRAVPVRVVSVAPLLPAWYASAEAAGAAAFSGDVYQRIIDDQRAAHEHVAATVAKRLTAQGLSTTAEVTEGDPAYSVIDAAVTAKAGLIVVGSRGTTGLARFFLGSVARGILYHAPCSVLVVPHAVAAVTPAATPAAGRAV